MTRYAYQPRLMGALIGVYAGDGFSLGFNVAWSMFGPDAEDIPNRLQRMNLAYEVTAGQIAGLAHPYIGVVGRAMGNWAAPSSFRDALLAAIGDLGFDVDYSSPINYEIMPKARSGSTQPIPAPRPSSTPTPKVRPRPGEPEEESVYFTIGTDLPSVTGTPGPYVPPLLPSDEQKKGINTTWLLLGFGLLAVVMISRD
jgi:hypothetical protein